MSEVCVICQENSELWKDIFKEQIGVPAIQIKELLEQCLEDIKELDIGHSENANITTVLCVECEWKLLEFYRATLIVAEKRCEFKLLLSSSKQSVASKYLNKEQSTAGNCDNDWDDWSRNDADSEWDCDEECKPSKIVLTDEKNITFKYIDVSEDVKCKTERPDRYCKQCKLECPSDDVFNLHLEKVHSSNTSTTKLNPMGIQFKIKLPPQDSYNVKVNLKKSNKSWRKYTCNICKQTFDSNALLNSHLDSHMPLTCLICGKNCTSKRSLNSHMEIHNEKKYQCEECGNQFRTIAHLNRHMQTHTGAKPHSCPICGKCFSQAYNMRVHVKEHEKPGSTRRQRFKCNKCSKTFVNKDKYEEHCQENICL